jgi:2-(1,2-epoxy-1,2-dihydrophenyl)acetyl-CoA isomerase
MTDRLLTKIDNGIATITFNRPDAMNAMDQAMAGALKEAAEAYAADPAVRVVVLAGAGSAFMAGGDIGTFAEHLDDLPALITRFAREFHHAILAFRRMPKPVLASVQGVAAGAGVSLMLAADLAIAAQSTKFTLAYARLGASPDGGATYFLPRVIGTRKALELALLPDRFDAAAALALGLVNWVVPDAELAARTAATATRLGEGPVRAYAETKALLNASLDNSLETQLEAEAQGFARCAAHPDIREGVRAFLDKRSPVFGR